MRILLALTFLVLSGCSASNANIPSTCITDVSNIRICKFEKITCYTYNRVSISCVRND